MRSSARWIAMRTLKERAVLHRKLLERKRNRGEEELMRRLEEPIATAEGDSKLLREILDRISSWRTTSTDRGKKLRDFPYLMISHHSDCQTNSSRS